MTTCEKKHIGLDQTSSLSLSSFNYDDSEVLLIFYAEQWNIPFKLATAY